MNPFPKQTICGECKRTVKLKAALWDVWTEGDYVPVGASQQRTCKNCKSLVLAVVGDKGFLQTLAKHFGDAAHTELTRNPCSRQPMH